MDEFEQARVQAMKNGREGAAVNATKEKSILSDHRIERSEVGEPGEVDAPSDDELERALLERLSALSNGNTLDTGSDTKH